MVKQLLRSQEIQIRTTDLVESSRKYYNISRNLERRENFLAA